MPELDELFRAQLSKSAQERWLREYRTKAEQVINDLQSGRAAHILAYALQHDLDDAEPPSRAMRTFVNTLHHRIEDAVANTTHPPMTGTHSHLHAGYDASGADDADDDGNHRHTHTHRNDNDHDHADQHDAQAADDGTMGAEINAKWPSQRAAARRARQGGLR
jgi:hypothetical protein